MLIFATNIALIMLVIVAICPLSLKFAEVSCYCEISFCLSLNPMVHVDPCHDVCNFPNAVHSMWFSDLLRCKCLCGLPNGTSLKWHLLIGSMLVPISVKVCSACAFHMPWWQGREEKAKF
ncbi:hypothetical protein COLO4_05394 [Corchorus olitorius]|uniref:Uncharacterized protein n=1 Tax=Corchorus olitorius TaxID=93759 RepID=A0A1R3KR15_9ROSI|nr:hypothetical protein COLO4_05394 [Corchorus olitorius]